MRVAITFCCKTVPFETPDVVRVEIGFYRQLLSYQVNQLGGAARVRILLLPYKLRLLRNM
jgi:hypothetical protein